MIVPFKTQNKKFIFIDYKTRQRVWEKHEFDFVYPFQYGFSIVKINNKFGIIDLTGKLTVPIIYSAVVDLNEFYAVISLNHKLGIIKLADGQLIIPPIYENLSNISENLILFAEEEDLYKNQRVDISIKYGFLNIENNIHIEPKYTPASDFSEGFSLVGQYGGMDDDYNEIIKYGYIDKNDRLVIDYIFDEGESFINGRAKVTQNGETFHINQEGERTEAYTESDEIISKKLNVFQKDILVTGGAIEKFGFKDNSGVVKINPIYDSVSDFKNGLSLVSIGHDYFYIDNYGEELYHRTEYVG